MSQESKHPTKVANYEGTLEQLAQAILSMRYDNVEEFFSYVSAELRRQSKQDRRRGRARLSILLETAATTSWNLKQTFARISTLCRPHIAGEFEADKPH
jgi:hypothetical protein